MELPPVPLNILILVSLTLPILVNLIKLKKQKSDLKQIFTAPIPLWMLLLVVGFLYLGFIFFQQNLSGKVLSETTKKEPIADSPQEPASEKKIDLEFVEFEANKKFWDLGDFTKQKDGFYCPREIENYDYYYIWYKEKISFVSSHVFEISSRPANLTLESTIGELVLKIGKNSNKKYSELYLPLRNRENVNYKQAVGNDLVFFQPGGDITTPVKPNRPIEVLFRLMLAEGNKINPKYYMTYISDTPNSERLTNEFIYPSLRVEEIRITNELVEMGLGIDKKSCIKIEKYKLNISDKEVHGIVDNY